MLFFGIKTVLRNFRQDINLTGQSTVKTELESRSDF